MPIGWLQGRARAIDGVDGCWLLLQQRQQFPLHGQLDGEAPCGCARNIAIELQRIAEPLLSPDPQAPAGTGRAAPLRLFAGAKPVLEAARAPTPLIVAPAGRVV